VPLLEGRKEIVSASGAKLDDATRLLDA